MLVQHPRGLESRSLHALVLALAAAAALAGIGCSAPPDPVGRLEVAPDRVTLGYPEWVDLELTWFALGSPDGLQGRPVVFAHLLDGAGGLVRTFDVPLAFDWEPGVERRQILQLRQSALAEALPPGEYGLSLGLYDPLTNERWPLAVAAELVGRFEYRAATVEVPQEGGGPSFSIAGDVLPAERGNDLQVQARIGLTGPAEIAVGGVASGGSIRLELVVVETVPALGGADPGSLLVSGTCDCPEVVVSTVGRHVLELALSPETGGGPCTLLLTPDDAMMVAMAVGRRALSLEGLAWK